MWPDPLLEARQFTVELVDRQYKRGTLEPASLVGAEVGQPVTQQVKRDLYNLQRLPSLLQVAVELDLGRCDQIEVICERGHFRSGVAAEFRFDGVCPIVNGHFHNSHSSTPLERS